jgi:hypothetical protein
MPPVEAMAAGCPVVVANCTCLPEICGDAAEYFEPTDAKALADTITKVRSDSRLRAELTRRGQIRARHFSAESMGRAHLGAFQDAVDSYSELRYRWHRDIYQPYHQWRVDKIKALGFSQAEGLIFQWSRNALRQGIHVAVSLCAWPLHQFRLRKFRKEIRIIESSGLFQQAFYDSQVSAGTGASRVGHYLLSNWRTSVNPNPLFHGIWYLQNNPDVNAAGWNPLLHFVYHGAKERRDPHPLFDVSWYLEQYPDVASSGINPLEHYLRHGAIEGRNPHPLFQSPYYLDGIRDYAQARLNPLSHYLAQPPATAKNPHPLFDGAWYLRKYPDVAAARFNPLVHYVLYGYKEGRDPHRAFDSASYLLQCPEVKCADLNPLIHFLKSNSQ